MTVRKALGRLLAAWLLACAPVHAAEPARRSSSRLARIGHHLAKVVREGDSSLYLSGYAYHKRTAYSPGMIRLLNEEAWGGGYGKSLRLPDNGVASIAFTAFVDSLGQWEYNLGYMREWRWAPFHGRLLFGAGLSAFVVSRPDFFGGAPFPTVLPQVSLTRGDVAAIAMLVPRIPDAGPAPQIGPGMNGDVAYVFARIALR